MRSALTLACVVLLAPGCHPDALAPPTPFKPAAHPPLPLLQGPETVTPVTHVIDVTWSSDPGAARRAAFVDWMVTSGYLAPLAQYGAAPVTVTHVTTSAIFYEGGAYAGKYDAERFLIEQVNAGALPAPVDGSLFLLQTPPGVHFLIGSPPVSLFLCGAFNTFGSSASTQRGSARYALADACASSDDTTQQASAALVDALTSSWWGFQGLGAPPFHSSAGTACVGSGPALVDGHAVARIYSNEAARVDHRPCVPAPDGPGFGVFATPATPAQRPHPGDVMSLRLGFWSTEQLPAPLQATLRATFEPADHPSVTTAAVDNGVELAVDIATASDGHSYFEYPPYGYLQVELTAGDYTLAMYPFAYQTPW